MFKRRLTKEQFDALTGDAAWQQKMYKVQGDGSYKLEAEPDEDTANLLTSKQAEKDRADALAGQVTTLSADVQRLTTELSTLKTERDNATRNKNKKDGNFDDIEADYTRRLEEKDAQLAAADEKHKAQVRKLMIDGTANTIAAEISTMPRQLARDLMDRMDVDFTAEPPKLIITKDGKASSMSLADLRKEFVDNPEYKPIIKASNASGGGANGSNSGNTSGASKPLKDMTEQERVALHRENPAEFRRLTAEASGATA